MSKDKQENEQAETSDEEEVVDFRETVPNWVEGDQTHGGRGRNIKNMEGCIREKGCRELGGVNVAIFETAVAFPKRLSENEKWTVVITGFGSDMNRLPKFGTKTRAEAMKAARYPSAWSKKASTVAQKVADAKASKEKEAKAEPVAEEVSAE